MGTAQPSTGTSAGTSRPVRALLPAGAVIVLGAALRLVQLWRPSASLDELADHSVGARSLGAAMRAQDGFPAVHAAVLHGWMRLFASIDAQRLLSALAGTLAVAATIWAATALLDRSAGVVAGLVVATSPVLVLAGREARPYGLAALAAGLATAGAARLWLRGDRRSAIATGAASGALFGTVYSAAPLAGLLCVLPWLRRRRPALLVALLVSGGVLAVPALWWLGPDVHFQQRLAVETAPRSRLGATAYTFFALAGGAAAGRPLGELRAASSGEVARTLAPWAIVLAACLVGVGIGLWTRWRSDPAHRPLLAMLVALVVVPLTFAAVLAEVGGVDLRPRHSGTIVIPFALVAAAAIGSSRVARVAVAGLLAVQLAGAAHLALDRRYQGTDFRGASTALAGERRPVVVVAGFAIAGLRAADVEAGRRSPPYLPGPSSEVDRGRFARLVAETTAAPGSGSSATRACAVLVFADDQNVDPDGALRRLLQRRGLINATPRYRGAGIEVVETPRCLDEHVAIRGPAPTEELPER